jgi:hypothetical protein
MLNEQLEKTGHKPEIPFNANELLKQFNTRINEIMGSVKTKLTDDAKQDNLIIKRRMETTNHFSQQSKTTPSSKKGKVQQPSYVETIEEVKSYRDE